MSGKEETQHIEEGGRQGVFKPEPGKIDKRHGDPEAGGKTSGQKVQPSWGGPAADTRAERYGDKIHYDKQ